MGRMSARFVALEIGKSAQWVYDLWQEMGLVVKNNFGDWKLTSLGKSIGGKMSKNDRLSVPTFDFSTIEEKMIDFYKNKHCK